MSGTKRGPDRYRRSINVLFHSDEWKTWLKAFGALLRARRTLLGVRAEDLATRLGVHHGTVRNWERGRSAPCPRSQYLLARQFGCTIAELQPATTTMPEVGDKYLESLPVSAPNSGHGSDFPSRSVVENTPLPLPSPSALPCSTLDEIYLQPGAPAPERTGGE